MEKEDWFQRLPKEAQEQFLAAEQSRQESTEVQIERFHSDRICDIRQAMILFGVMNFIVYEISFTALLFGLVVGAFVGFLWNRFHAGQLLSPLISMPVMFVLVWPRLNPQAGFSILFSFCAVLFVGAVSVFIGVTRSERVMYRGPKKQDF